NDEIFWTTWLAIWESGILRRHADRIAIRVHLLCDLPAEVDELRLPQLQKLAILEPRTFQELRHVHDDHLPVDAVDQVGREAVHLAQLGCADGVDVQRLVLRERETEVLDGKLDAHRIAPKVFLEVDGFLTGVDRELRNFLAEGAHRREPRRAEGAEIRARNVK